MYIFTDFSRAAWPLAAAAQLQDSLKKLPGVGIYVIDVGVSNPVDYALGEPRLSNDVLSSRSPLTIQTDLSVIGKKGSGVFFPEKSSDHPSPWKRLPTPFHGRWNCT